MSRVSEEHVFACLYIHLHVYSVSERAVSSLFHIKHVVVLFVHCIL